MRKCDVRFTVSVVLYMRRSNSVNAAHYLRVEATMPCVPFPWNHDVIHKCAVPSRYCFALWQFRTPTVCI